MVVATVVVVEVEVKMVGVVEKQEGKVDLEERGVLMEDTEVWVDSKVVQEAMVEWEGDLEDVVEDLETVEAVHLEEVVAVKEVTEEKLVV